MVHDLTGLGARFFYPQFCSSSDFLHVGTKQLQCILLKVALLLGVTVMYNTSYDGITQHEVAGQQRKLSRVQVTTADAKSPLADPASELLEVDVVVVASGQGEGSVSARAAGFTYTKTSTGAAIGLVAHFENEKTSAETKLKECSWALQFNQSMFAELRRRGLDLENVVYYRGEAAAAPTIAHTFICTFLCRCHTLLRDDAA